MINLLKNNEYIVADMEFNTSYDASLIQISAHKIKNKKIIDSFSYYVKLPQYIKYDYNLDKINFISEQELKKMGLDFNFVMKNFENFVDNLKIFVFGNFDKIALERNYKRKKQKPPKFLNNLIDIQSVLKKESLSLTRSLEEKGIKFNGEQHNAYYDSYNLGLLTIYYSKLTKEEILAEIEFNELKKKMNISRKLKNEKIDLFLDNLDNIEYPFYYEKRLIILQEKNNELQDLIIEELHKMNLEIENDFELFKKDVSKKEIAEKIYTKNKLIKKSGNSKLIINSINSIICGYLKEEMIIS